MNLKFNLTKINWKFKLAIAFVISLAAVLLLKFPASQAQTDESAARGKQELISSGKMTEYANGVTKVEPLGFGKTGAVRDMPTFDPDALAKRATFVSSEERREQLAKDELEAKGIFISESDEVEINKQNAERVKTVVPGAGTGFEAFQDSLLKEGKNLYAPELTTMPTPSLTFDGGTQADNASQGIGALSPPDVNGDVGPNHYVSSVNLVLKMFNKSGAVVAGPVKTSSLFASLPAGDPCRVQNSGDPVVLYDPLADRWHVSQFALPSGGTNYQCVALSVTGDPTGAYYVWSYPYPGGLFNDYPKVGVWSDAYHMTFNQFNNAGNAFLGAGVLSQDRKKALVGDPTASVVYFNFYSIDPKAAGLLPGDFDGQIAPPAGLAEVLGEYRADEFGDPKDAIRLYRWSPNFTNPANSSLTVLPDVVLAPFDARQPTAAGIEQMGGTNLDSLADRSMHRFAYRNFGTTANPINSYVGNFSVNVSGVNPVDPGTYQTGIRWFEMRRVSDTFSVFDQGTHNYTPGNGASGLNDWMGSIAQDNRGDIALGFSQAGTTQKADIKIAGRTNNIKDSGTLNEGESLFYPAGGSQTSTRNRWGDYSAMNVDPTDDCTFWYTQEYYAATSSSGWSTRVGKFRYPQCVDAPKATITGTITNCNGGAPLSRASVDATGGFNRVTGAPGTYTMIVAPGTYTVSANKSGGFNATGAQPVTVADGETATANICLTGVPVVSSGTPQIASESCPIPNGAPDPGEQITVSLPLHNTGAAGTVNLTATLQATGGVINPSPASQSYGALLPGGEATRNFPFTVDSTIACGSQITLTFNVTDGAIDYGTVTQTYTTGTRSASFNENFDGVATPALPAGWTSVQTSGTAMNWATTTTTSSSAPNTAFANEPTTVNAAALLTPPIVIKETDAQISFKNFYNTEASSSSTGVGFDGMVLEYSTNGGVTWTDIITGGGSFASGGYNKTISTSDGSSLAGRRAWSGNSGGFLDSVVNLPVSLVGQTVKFRWVMASDNGTSGVGVKIDNVQILGFRQCSTGCAQSFEADISPRPSGDGSVDITDVQQILRFQSGANINYQSNEFQRADCSPRSTSGDGVININDVQQALRYQSGADAPQTAGGSSAAGQLAALFSGFELLGGKLAAPSVNTVVKAVGGSAAGGQTVTVQILVDAQGTETGFGFSLNYDNRLLTFVSAASGTDASGSFLQVTPRVDPNNPNNGQIGVGILLNNELAAGGNKQILTVQFTVAAGAAAQTTAIVFGNAPATESTTNTNANPVATTYQDGAVTITRNAPTTVAVSGRTTTVPNVGLAGVSLSLLDVSSGLSSMAISDQDGYYHFDGLTPGGNYVITASLTGYSFTPSSRSVSPTSDTNNLDFTVARRKKRIIFAN